MSNRNEKPGHKAKVDTTNPLEFKESISALADDKKVELLFSIFEKFTDYVVTCDAAREKLSKEIISLL